MLATPKPASRPHLPKRNHPTCSTASSAPPPPPPPKRAPGRPRKVAMVVIPTSKAVMTPTRTTQLPPAAPKTRKPTTPYPRRYGPTLNLSDKALARIPEDWVPPPADQVHPKLLPAVLFRFWSEDQVHCLNSRDGFIAGKYIMSNCVSKIIGERVTSTM